LHGDDFVVDITDDTGMNNESLEAGRSVIQSIIDEFFTAEEKRRFNRKGVKIRIAKLPPDIAGQNIGREVILDPETVTRADGVTEDVVVHEMIHAQNRFLEEDNPNVYLRKESINDSPEDFRSDTEIEEAITEAMTTARLHRFDKTTGKPIPKKKGSLERRYNRHIKGHLGKDWLKHNHVHSHFDKDEEWQSLPGHEHEHDPLIRKKKRFPRTFSRHEPGHTARDEVNDYTQWLQNHSREDFERLLEQTFGDSPGVPKQGFMAMWDEENQRGFDDLPFSLMRWSMDSGSDEQGNGNPLFLNMLRWDSIRLATEGFMFEGTQITNPFYDESMRFEVDPEQYYGKAYRDWRFGLWNTGMSDDEIADLQAGLRGSMLAQNNPNDTMIQRELKEGDRYQQISGPGGNWRIFEDEDGYFTLNAKPIDVKRLEEIIEKEGYVNWRNEGFIGLDERAGDVIEKKVGYVAQIIENNKGFLEEDIIGIYDSEESRQNAITEYLKAYPIVNINLTNGDAEITTSEIDAEDMFETYRKWPYLMNHKDTLYLKTGMKNDQVIYSSVDAPAWDGVGDSSGSDNAPSFLSYNWVTGDEPNEYEMTGMENVERRREEFRAGQWKDSYYFRKLRAAVQGRGGLLGGQPKGFTKLKIYERRIGNQNFRGFKDSQPKNAAILTANRIRMMGRNARVIPSRNGWRVYVGNRKR
tara:strand:+ start:560 stop:2641 length:2082 start_codon:yes stop_codon:yes gene_type:complete